MRSLARWCLKHRTIVIVLWIAALIVANVAKSSAGTHYADSFKLGNTDSARAQALLQQTGPAAAGDSEQIVVAVDSGTINDAANKRRIERMLKNVGELPHVASITSPYDEAGAGQVSKDQRVAFATVNLDGDSNKLTTAAADKFVSTARDAAGDGLSVEIGGQLGEAGNQGSSSTGIGVIAALIVMMLVFGSLLAAVTPLVTTGIALGTGIAVTGLLSNVLGMASFASELSLLIGLGVGVDYALFIVTRMRQAIQRGLSVDDAIVEAIDTSGRAVLFAGATVVIALLGLFAVGVSFLYGVAIAASIAVAFTVMTALTLLPAMLSFIGLRVFSRKQRRKLLSGDSNPSTDAGFWTRWSETVRRRPVVVAVLATGVMAALAVPYFSMRLGSSDNGSSPTTSSARRAYDLLAEGFGPGYNGPLMLVAKVSDAKQQQQFKAAINQVAQLPGVAGSTPTTFIPSHSGGVSVGMANLYPTGSPQDESTTELLRELRDTAIPSATNGTNLEVLVGGSTATFEDFASVISSKLPAFIGIVVLLSFVLLMAVFRSLLVPAMAAAMNLLTAAAGFGVLTAIFQWGWGLDLLGSYKTGPIEAFVPVMMFAIVFGLSMDYQVFLLSRIFEEWHRTRDNALAITRGLAATGRTITAAATIMVLVFGSFVLGGERVIQLFGVGLASAVALDALVVRSALVPSLMHLAGERNWWLPAWLDRVLPSLNVEGQSAPSADARSHVSHNNVPA